MCTPSWPPPRHASIQTWHACCSRRSATASTTSRSARMRRGPSASGCIPNTARVPRRLAGIGAGPCGGVASSGFTSRLGIPRTDNFFGDESRSVAAVRRRCSLPDGRRVILYAPTFRGETTTTMSPTTSRPQGGPGRRPRPAGASFVRSRRRPSATSRTSRSTSRRTSTSAMSLSDILVTDYSDSMSSPRPADGLLRARLRGVREGARLLFRLQDRRAGADLRRRARDSPRTWGR